MSSAKMILFWDKHNLDPQPSGTAYFAEIDKRILKHTTLIHGGVYDGCLAIDGETIEAMLQFAEQNKNGWRITSISRGKEDAAIVHIQMKR